MDHRQHSRQHKGALLSQPVHPISGQSDSGVDGISALGCEEEKKTLPGVAAGVS
jgi:hypothetical protein